MPTKFAADAEFDLFWSHYPKKKDKGDTRKAWMQTAAIRPPLLELLEAIERGKRSVDWHKCDREGCAGAFIPYPATYLRGERWSDEYTVSLCSIRTVEIKAEPKPEIVPPSTEQKERVRDMLKGAGLRSVA